MLGILRAEFLKMKGARVPRMCAICIVVVPFLWALPNAVGKALGGGYNMMSWKMFVETSQACIAAFVGPALLGLVATFLFAREFVEGTARNLFALPVSRAQVVFAKLIVLLCWSAVPPVLAFLVLVPLGLAIWSAGMSWEVLRQAFPSYAWSGILIYSTLPLTCLVSMMSRGYIVPLVYTVLAYGVAAFGLDFSDYLTACLILAGTFLLGVALCVIYLNKAQIDR